MILSRTVAGCGVLWAVYSDRTNQVPATWFACDAGIRRLASLSDGPARGRRRVFTQSDKSPVRALFGFLGQSRRATNAPGGIAQCSLGFD